MNCCENCFNDIDIKSRIRKNNERGNCDFCLSQDVYVFNIEKGKTNTEYSKDIILDFSTLVDLFIVYEDENEKFVDESKKMSDYLLSNTNIFNAFKLNSNKISKLLKKLLPNEYKKLLNSMVIPQYLLNEDFKLENSIFKGKSWLDFEKDIKFESRFHSSSINENVLEYFINYLTVDIDEGERYFRARISPDGKPIAEKNMGAAPSSVAMAGRLNPSGMGYLYLCKKPDVAISEIKASRNDICTIAEFETHKKLKVVDLSQIGEVSIFSFDEKEKYLMNFFDLSDIDNAMRKSSDKNRLEVEYVPTEYISDFIKSIGIDGIIYASTIDLNTKNLILFNEENIRMLPQHTQTILIKGITYSTETI
jgi:RES domain-containing protein